MSSRSAASESSLVPGSRCRPDGGMFWSHDANVFLTIHGIAF